MPYNNVHQFPEMHYRNLRKQGLLINFQIFPSMFIFRTVVNFFDIEKMFTECKSEGPQGNPNRVISISYYM